MPHALLLSPDDQAVTAITDVLQEMSVSCERPLDGVSAAQKLNSQSFDLVLVDCENLPAAKLIFDVCRRGKNGNNPVPIAIVDGRAGLPTAFRLGAELILTKPVAKDQARGTIRTAVGRVRKPTPANESTTAQPSSTPAVNMAAVNAATVNPATNGSAMTEDHTQAAAAATVSSQLTSFDEPAQSFVASSLTSAAPGMSAGAASTAVLDSPAVTTKTYSSVDEIDAPSVSQSSTHAAPVESKSTRPLVPSDDPVLAELERMELEESRPAEAQKTESRKQSSGPDKKALDQSSPDQSSPDRSSPDKAAAESVAPVFSSYQHGQRKTRAPLLALLMLTLAAGGFYTAWTYQPGFRALAQPQINRVLALVGMAAPSTSAPSPATTAATAQASPSDSNLSSNLPPATAPDSATSPAGSPSTAQTTSVTTGATTGTTIGPTATSNAASIPVTPPAKPLTATNTTVAPPASGTTTIAVASKPATSKPGDIGISANKNDSKVDIAAMSSSAPLPGETSAVILSSKGAENRLAHSVPVRYPAEAHAEGTVLLKVVVDADGKVEGLRLIEGNATLATAAMQAVKQWRYRPYVRDGKAQIFQTVVIVDFQKP
jgi:TonB family protein